MSNPGVALQSRIQPYRAQLAAHPLYEAMRTVEDLQIFLEAHVFAVWDFMSLLKVLQRNLTCVDVPWLPVADAESRRFINEIVLGEESDCVDGRTFSHFELYLEAMRECGANSRPITEFVKHLRNGSAVSEAIVKVEVPGAAADFVESTYAVIKSGSLPAIAAAFTFGREDLIPDMFRGFVRGLNETLPGRVSTFLFYLERHIEVDGDDHGPMALRLMNQLCGGSEVRWQEAAQAAEAALKARVALWDGIHRMIEIQQNQPSFETVTA